MREICVGQIIFVLQWRWRDNPWEFPSGTIENCSVLSENGEEKNSKKPPFSERKRLQFPWPSGCLSVKAVVYVVGFGCFVCVRVFVSSVLLVAKNILFIFFESHTLILRNAALDFWNLLWLLFQILAPSENLSSYRHWSDGTSGAVTSKL